MSEPGNDVRTVVPVELVPTAPCTCHQREDGPPAIDFSPYQKRSGHLASDSPGSPSQKKPPKCRTVEEGGVPRKPASFLPYNSEYTVPFSRTVLEREVASDKCCDGEVSYDVIDIGRYKHNYSTSLRGMPRLRPALSHIKPQLVRQASIPELSPGLKASILVNRQRVVVMAVPGARRRLITTLTIDNNEPDVRDLCRYMYKAGRSIPCPSSIPNGARTAGLCPADRDLTAKQIPFGGKTVSISQRSSLGIDGICRIGRDFDTFLKELLLPLSSEAATCGRGWWG
ncbi:hypothetical protein Bbelb_333940 [Branchiostoma belcheri]|nr:hypothetical protein Bbelb_333940 [Branchiostoma belcheri]